MAKDKALTRRWSKALNYKPRQVRVLQTYDASTCVCGSLDHDYHVATLVESGARGWYMQTLYYKDSKLILGLCNCIDYLAKACRIPHPFIDGEWIWTCKHTLASSTFVHLERMGVNVMTYPTLRQALNSIQGKGND